MFCLSRSRCNRSQLHDRTSRKAEAVPDLECHHVAGQLWCRLPWSADNVHNGGRRQTRGKQRLGGVLEHRLGRCDIQEEVSPRHDSRTCECLKHIGGLSRTFQMVTQTRAIWHSVPRYSIIFLQLPDSKASHVSNCPYATRTERMRHACVQQSCICTAIMRCTAIMSESCIWTAIKCDTCVRTAITSGAFVVEYGSYTKGVGSG